MKRIYIIWGGVLGFDGVIDSAGLIGLENRLRELGRVKSYLQERSYACADDIYDECAADDKSVLIGYSGGSVMATRICNHPLLARNQRIDLLVNIDGSPARNMEKVSSKNVKLILNIYDPKPWIFGGGTTCSTDDSVICGELQLNIPHLAFQTNQEVSDIIYNTVYRL